MLEGGNKGFSVGVVILAAGASRRMGEPKLLLPWGETSVLGHILQRWKTLKAAQIAVVCAAGARPLMEELDRLDFPATNRIFNETPEDGMFSSIRGAAGWGAWNPGLTHVVITLGDQPHLQTATLRKLLEFGSRNPNKICQPMRGERRKHPVLLPKRLFAKLKDASSGDLKMFLVEHAKELSGFDSDDAGLDFDMDTREDYEKLRRTFLQVIDRL